MDIKTLENSFVCLRPYESKHIHKTVQWLSNPHIQENFGLNEVTLVSHQQWLEKNQDVLKWAIYTHDYIGNLFLFENTKHHSGYFQIYLGEEDARGKGTGFQALSLMLDYAFSVRHLHRVWMHCYPKNVQAIKLYEKLGFAFEGLERESIYKNGEYISQGRWSLLAQEWHAWRNTQ